MLEHPHLAAVLVLDVRRRLLERQRLGVVDRPPSALHHEVREREVVAEARVDVDVVGAPNGIDGAVAAGDRARLRLLLAEPRLHPPVGALDVRAVRSLEHEPAAAVGDLGIGERADELAQRVGRPRRIRVRERDDVGIRPRDGEVLCRNLPAARALEQRDARLARGDLPDDLVRAVRGRVGGDDDLEELGRVVELEEVLDATRDHVLLVVRGDDDRDRGQDVLAPHGPRRDPRGDGRRRGIARRASTRAPPGCPRRPSASARPTPGAARGSGRARPACPRPPSRTRGPGRPWPRGRSAPRACRGSSLRRAPAAPAE